MGLAFELLKTVAEGIDIITGVDDHLDDDDYSTLDEDDEDDTTKEIISTSELEEQNRIASRLFKHVRSMLNEYASISSASSYYVTVEDDAEGFMDHLEKLFLKNGIDMCGSIKGRWSNTHDYFDTIDDFVNVAVFGILRTPGWHLNDTYGDYCFDTFIKPFCCSGCDSDVRVADSNIECESVIKKMEAAIGKSLDEDSKKRILSYCIIDEDGFSFPLYHVMMEVRNILLDNGYCPNEILATSQKNMDALRKYISPYLDGEPSEWIEFDEIVKKCSYTDTKLDSKEQEYINIYKEMLDDYDGEIGPRERKQLDRERTTLGISAERAKELEESLSKKDLVFTDKEQEYLELYKEMLEDYEGEIGPRERKQLERNRTRLGISESRAAEIEASLKGDNNNNFAAEQEYLDLVRELLADYGSIGAPQRKQLERTRARLEISEQRAKEIEDIVLNN